MTDREWLAGQGLCTCCGKVPPVRGHRYCPECQEKTQERYRALRQKYPERYEGYARRATERYREKKKAGICVVCSQPATHGRFCLKHKRKSIYYSKRRNERRKEEAEGTLQEMMERNGNER